MFLRIHNDLPASVPFNRKKEMPKRQDKKRQKQKKKKKKSRMLKFAGLDDFILGTKINPKT